MDPERPAAELVAVPDQVVCDRERTARLGLRNRLPLRRRPRERMVRRAPGCPSGRHSNSGSQSTQRNAHARLADQPEPASELQPEHAEHAATIARVGGEEERLAGLAPTPSWSSERNFAIGDAPRRSRRGRGTRAPSRPTASPLLELRELAAGEAPRHAQVPDGRRAAKTPNSEPRVARSRPRSRGRSGGRAGRSRTASSPRRTSCRGNGSRARRRGTPATPWDDPLHQPEDELAVGERHLDVELGHLLDAGRRADPRPGSRVAIW